MAKPYIHLQKGKAKVIAARFGCSAYCVSKALRFESHTVLCRSIRSYAVNGCGAHIITPYKD